MSRMSDLDIELERLSDLDMAVRNYLSCLAAFEQGSDEDGPLVDYWRSRLDALTCDAAFESFGGDRFDKYGKPIGHDR